MHISTLEVNQYIPIKKAKCNMLCPAFEALLVVSNGFAEVLVP